MAETELARQLKKLAVPQTTILLQDKIKASFLYDPREASSIDRDTFFALGVTGLEQLQLIDPEFSIFENTLFNESSKMLERSVQTAEVNAKLDKNIHQFLIMVSPYFLLRPSHKAIEWLIHRFHIHMFNGDSILACILPYHETRTFIRMLQLLNLNDPTSRWHWLQPLQKPGVPLPKTTLLNHCYKDLWFMRFICELVTEMIKVYGKENLSVLKTVISFYTSTALGAVESSDKVSENMIITLLPYILKGLRSGILDYCASSYMIIGQLVKCSKLAPSLSKKLVIKISKTLMPDLKNEGIMCLLVIYEHQQLKQLPKVAFSNLCAETDFGKNLSALASHYHITSFFLPLLKKLIPSALRLSIKNKRKKLLLLQNILKNINLDKNVVALTTRITINQYVKIKNECRQEMLQSLQEACGPILRLLERRYPESFDESVSSLLSKKPENYSEEVHSLIGGFLSHSELQTDGEAELFLNISHPNPNVRSLAIDVLVAMLKKEEITSGEFVEDVLSARLCDDDPIIVKKILNAHKILLKNIQHEKLLSALCSLLKKEIKRRLFHTWWPIKIQALNLILDVDDLAADVHSSLLLVILPLLFPLKREAIDMVSSILSSSVAQKMPLLVKLKEDCSSYLQADTTQDTNSRLVALNCAILVSLGNYLISRDKSDRNKMVEALIKTVKEEESLNVSLDFIAIYLLQFIIVGESLPDDKLLLAQEFVEISQHIIKAKKVLHLEENVNAALTDIMPLSIKALLKSQFPVGIIVFSLRNIISSIKHINVFSESKWWLHLSNWPNNQYYRLLLSLFKMITEQENATQGKAKHIYQQLLAVFFKFQLPSLREMLMFLSTLWLQMCNETQNLISSVLQLQALCIAQSVSEESQESLNWVFEEDSTLVPSLLVALVSSHEPIRDKALLFLHHMVYNINSNDGIYKELCKYVCDHGEEIRADEKQLPQIVSNWLSESLNKNQPVRQTRLSVASLSNQESEILQQLFHLVTDVDAPFCVKHAILLVLKQTNGEKVLSTLLPVLSLALSSYKNKPGVEDVTIIQQILNKYIPSTALLLNSPDAKEFIVLCTALNTVVLKESSSDTFVQQIALEVLTPAFFYNIPSPQVQQKLLTVVIDLYVNCATAEMGSKILKVLKKLCKDASLLLKELQQFDSTVPKTTVREVKRQRIAQPTALPVTDILEEMPWNRIIILLEIIQNKKKMKQKKLLVAPLFDLLKRSLELENGSSSEYVRQVILTCLSNFCKSLENEQETIDERKFQVELVVQCVRVSNNPQTQHHALILLNWAATMFPEHVLHNIMAIFTFMGTSLARQDDSYSFQIIYQTVETVIPALLEASQHKAVDETQQIVAAVTRVFVDALPDIPRHRQLPLFIKLVTTLGPSDFLWLPLVQIMDTCVMRTHETGQKDKNKPIESQHHPLIEFSISLCDQFSPKTQAMACLRLMEFLLNLPWEKKDHHVIKARFKETRNTKEFKELFDVTHHSEKQLKHFRHTVAIFMTGLFSSSTYIGKVADLSSEESQQMEPLYQMILESVLQYILQGIQLEQKHSSEPSGKFWKFHQHKLYDLLDKVNCLMHNKQFISVMAGLMKNKVPSIRRKAMDMLNARLLQQSTGFNSEDIPALLSLIKPLLKIVRKKLSLLDSQSEPETSGDEGDDVVVNRQSALFSLKLLCKMFGQENPDNFIKVLQVVVKILKSPVHHYLAGNAALCLAELCHCLRAYAVPYLNDFLPPLIELLQNEDKLTSNELLLLSILTAVQHVIENLAAFLSSYLEPLLTQVCILSALQSEESKEKSGQKCLKAIHSHLSKELEPRVLLPAIEHCYQTLSEKNTDAIRPLMDILSEKISTMEKSEINAYFSQLQSFFLLALDFRSKQFEKCSDVECVESSIISALLALVLKLSETMFRPMFFKLFDWATRTEHNKERILTFYKLCDDLAETLKSLFVLFAGHFVKNAAYLLDLNNTIKSDEQYFGRASSSVFKSCYLLKYLLNTLCKCFLYGGENFVDKERFNVLMQPLVDQIENLQGSDEDYQQRIVHHLTPCLAQFASAAGDDALWKSLNFQILLKTRNSSPKVRFAALQVIREVVRKLGDDYLVILPESIPFLAELMEDESLEVEKECQNVIADMEKVLGESLMKYF